MTTSSDISIMNDWLYDLIQIHIQTITITTTIIGVDIYVEMIIH